MTPIETPIETQIETGAASLALVPAALLVLLVLAAIAVDSASEYLARRELAAAADAAANDAATFGLDEAALP